MNGKRQVKGKLDQVVQILVYTTLKLSVVFKFVPFCRYLSFRSQNCWSISQITENAVLFSSHSVCSNLWSKNVSLTSFLPEVAKIEFENFAVIVFLVWISNPVILHNEEEAMSLLICDFFFACLCHWHGFEPSVSLVPGSVLKSLLEFYIWASVMYVIQCMCVLWVARRARNPNL